jgi:nitroreductase
MLKKSLLTLMLLISACCTADSTVNPLFLKRRSGYCYDNSRSVTKEQLLSILEAGRLAPSSYNDQPWNFIVCDRATTPEAYEKALSILVESNQEWAKNAQILIISVASSYNKRNGEFNRWAEYDTGAAAYGMMLQATSMGLMAHQMGGFDEEKALVEFSIPNGFVPMSVMAIGYQCPKEVLQPKSRKSLSENFFMGKWGS